MSARLDMEQSAATLLDVYVRRVLKANRWKGTPTQTVEQLLRLAADEIDEALHAIRTGRGTEAVLREIGDAGAYLAFAAYQYLRGAS